MSKKIIIFAFAITCITVAFLMQSNPMKKTFRNLINTKSVTNIPIDREISSNKVKKIDFIPSRILITHFYHYPTNKSMAKDIYSEKEIKKIVDFINSVQYKEQVKYKSEIEKWDFLIRFYESNNIRESVTLYNNDSTYAFRNFIAGVRINKDTYDKFLNLYESLECAEVHWTKIKN